MKKLILSALAMTLVAGPLAATAAGAQPVGQQYRDGPAMQERGDRADHRDERPQTRTVVTQRTVSHQPQHRGWRRGERFDARQADHYQVIDYRQHRGLRAPPRGYRYVRSGNDAVLVGIASGIIASVFAGAIR